MLVNQENISNIKNAYLHKKCKGEFFPAVYVIEITNNCTLNCIMCLHSEIRSNCLGDMNINLFEQIVKEISLYAEHVMLYFMGEPLLHPQFDQILPIARKWIKGKISICTNNLYLNESKINTIINNQIDFIVCCIDHLNKEKYEKIRIGSDFDIVINNIENLIRIRNGNSIPQILIKALDINFDEKEKKQFYSYWNRDNISVIIGWIDTWAGQLKDLYADRIDEQPYANKKRVACADLWFKMIINWQGKVVLCCHNFNYSIKLGKFSMNQDSLQNVWQGENIQYYRNNHLKNTFKSLCKNCTEWAELDELDVYNTLNKKKLHLVF